MIGCLDCGNEKIEAEGRCASCRHAIRKAEREASKPKKVYQLPRQNKPIPKVSEKRSVDNEKYDGLRKAFLVDNPDCQAKLLECEKKSTDVHHAAKRGRNFLEVSTWMAVCRTCHTRIETVLSAPERREQGFLI